MKTCYMCKGEVKLSLVDVEIKGIVVKDIPAEVCTRCGEKYFDTKTASFIQDITGCINEKKRGYIVDIVSSARNTKNAVEA
ncbi:MAG: YgiT-type zinc finger protein [Candidatus Methanoperedens sp.]|nr:YgiT-type zinc finger protein [Candidatus Methanoperedens sp.]